MKRVLLATLILFSTFLSKAQCDDDVSICTPGVAGPFNFTNTVGPPTDYADASCGTGGFADVEEFAFITLNITTSGELDILIDGDGGAGSGYLDVVIYNIPPGVAPCDAVMNDANEIGCNYAANMDGCVQLGDAPNINCNSLVDAPVVNAGDQLMIIVHNYGNFAGSGNTNFTLELGNAGTSAQTGPADATITDEAPVLETDGPITMGAATGGGTWSATCGGCIDPVTGAFDPSVAGVGDHDICYTAGAAPCDDNDCSTITVNPDCNIFFSFTNHVGPGNCETTQDLSGTVDIVSGFPATGDLIVEDCNGVQDIVASAPFAPGSYNFALTTPADGAACSITAYFSDQPACNDVHNYTSFLGTPGNEAGTFNVSHTGDGLNTPTPATTQYVLCDQDQFFFNSNGDWDIADITAGTPDPTDVYDPGIIYFIYSCPPSPGGVGITPWVDDPCWAGFINGPDDIALTNDGGIADPLLGALLNGDNSYYIVPITFYDKTNVSLQSDCYDLSIADAYEVQYLNPITFTFTEDCQAGTASITVFGGYPEFYAGEEFTGSALSHGAFTDNTAQHGQTITISGLTAGDDYSFDVIDQNGCPITINPAGTFPPLFDAAFSYATDTYCSTDTDPTPMGVTNPGGTYSSIQGGISLNAGNGAIDLSASTGGTYDIVYSTEPLDAVCFDTDTFQVTINMTPVVDDVTDVNQCGTYTIPNVGAIDNANNTGTLGFYNGPNGTGGQIAFGSAWNTVGTTTIYIYDETSTTPNCFDAEDFDVTINLTPAVDDVADVVLCDSYTIPAIDAIDNTNNTGALGFYNGPNGTGGQIAFGSAWTTAGTTTIYIYDETGTMPNCFMEEQFDVTINESINAGTDDNATLCNVGGNSLTLSTMLNGADVGGIWSETTGLPYGSPGMASGQFNPVTTVFDASGLATGTYSFMYLQTTALPCVNDTAFFTINVTGLIDAGADNTATYCNTTGSDVDVHTLIDPGVTGGAWSQVAGPPTGNFNSTTGMFDMSDMSSGTYVFRYSIPDSGPCLGDDADISITINEIPYINNPSDVTVCDTYVLPAINGTSLTGGVGYYTAPNGGGTNLAVGSNITNVGGNSIYVYDETGTTPNCFDQDTFVVTVNLTPVVDDVTDAEVCGTYTLPTQADVDNANNTGNLGLFTEPNGGGTQLNFGAAFTTVGTSTIYIYDETGTIPNCSANHDFEVIVNLTPVVDDVADGNYCNDYTLPSVADADNANNTANLGLFTAPNGGGTQLNFGDLFNTPGTTTIYIYDETGTMPNCFDEEQFDVTISNSVSAGPDNSDEICAEGGTVDIGALLDPTADAGGSWSETTASGQFNIGTLMFDVTGLSAGDYSFKYELNGVAPCISEIAEFTVVVHPLPIVEAGADFTECQGVSILLGGSVAANSPVGSAGMDSYTWDQGVVDGVLYLPGGTNTYNIVGIDTNGCQATDNITVDIEASPIVSYDPILSGCSPLSTTCNYTVSNGVIINSSVWTISNGDIFNGNNISTTFTDEGPYDFTLDLVSANGCNYTFTEQDYFSVNVKPIASFTHGPGEYTVTNPITEFTNQSDYANGYEWTFGDGNTSTQEHPTHTYVNEPSSYEVQLIALGAPGDPNCVDTAVRIIEILDELLYHIPNTFTPDQDDFNETFQPVFISGFDPYDFTLLIFDRWGEILFESHDASIGWDGKYGGKIVKDGSYIWKIDFKETMSDKRHSKLGHVNVLR